MTNVEITATLDNGNLTMVINTGVRRAELLTQLLKNHTFAKCATVPGNKLRVNLDIAGFMQTLSFLFYHMMVEVTDNGVIILKIKNNKLAAEMLKQAAGDAAALDESGFYCTATIHP